MQNLCYSSRKILQQLFLQGSYQPSKYLEINAILSPEQNILIVTFVQAKNFSHPQIIIFCDCCRSFLPRNDISILLERSNDDQQKSYEDLCIKCLCKMIKSSDSLKGRYYVRQPNIFSFTKPNWRVSDDILLFKGIQKYFYAQKRYGYGNWQNIALWMQFNGSFVHKKEFETHFMLYLNELKDKKTGIKHLHFVQAIDQKQSYKRPYYLSSSGNQSKSRKSQEKIKSVKKQGHQTQASNDLSMSLSSINSNQKCQQQTFPYSHLAMYTPERDEFFLDSDPYAQSIISNLEFGPNDTEQEVKLKEQLLIAYNERLQERQKRKKFVIEEDLLSRINCPVKLQVKKEFRNQLLMDLEETQSIKGEKSENSGDSIFESCCNDNFQKLQRIIASSKKYFLDEEELQETQNLAKNYVNIKTLNTSFEDVQKDLKKQRKKKLKTLKELTQFLKRKISTESIIEEASERMKTQKNEKLPTTISKNLAKITTTIKSSESLSSIHYIFVL